MKLERVIARLIETSAKGDEYEKYKRAEEHWLNALENTAEKLDKTDDPKRQRELKKKLAEQEKKWKEAKEKRKKSDKRGSLSKGIKKKIDQLKKRIITERNKQSVLENKEDKITLKIYNTKDDMSDTKDANKKAKYKLVLKKLKEMQDKLKKPINDSYDLAEKLEKEMEKLAKQHKDGEEYFLKKSRETRN